VAELFEGGGGGLVGFVRSVEAAADGADAGAHGHGDAFAGAAGRADQASGEGAGLAADPGAGGEGGGADQARDDAVQHRLGGIRAARGALEIEVIAIGLEGGLPEFGSHLQAATARGTGEDFGEPARRGDFDDVLDAQRPRPECGRCGLPGG